MNKCDFWMEGSFTLNDKVKMQEMNELILKLLRKTGIGRLTTRTVNEKKLNVFKQAAPDKNGIVKFDFSIFEKKRRKGNYYDTKTGILVTPDRGYNHFGLTMNIIMAVMECYSETPYYLMYKDNLANVVKLAKIVDEITNVKLKFDNRARAFDTTVFFKKKKEYKNFEYDLYAYPYNYTDVDIDQFLYTEFELQDQIASYGTTKNAIEERIKAYQCFKFLKENKDLKEKALEYIIKLVDMPLNERKEEKVKRSDSLSIIADIAEFVPSPFLVQIYAEAYNIDFFQLWFQIGKNGYWDFSRDRKKPTQKLFKNTHKLKKLYHFENEDNFIGIWNDEDMIISETLANNLQIYKMTYSKIDETELKDFDTIVELLFCLKDMDEIWNKERYVDCDMLEEFIKNKNDIRYKKAVFTLKQMINDEIGMFSELTEQQIRKCILKIINKNFYADKYWHYLDLLSNKSRRKELLGF